MSQPLARAGALADRMMRAVGRWLGITSGALIAAIAVFLLFDALSRHIIGVSSGASDQITSVLATFALASAFPYALYSGAHIAIEILVVRYPMKAQRVLARLAALLFSAFAGIVAFALATVAVRSVALEAMVQSTAIPLWMPQMFAVGALTFLALAALLQAITGSAPPIDLGDAIVEGATE